ncbi:MAG: hypothetical protein ACMUIG_09535 [Thermoplasmatota archaeon]
MVAYCSDCRRYVNQYCERCAGNFGVSICERYGCGGRMLCPICGGNNLTTKREEAAPYDFSKERPLKYRNKAASDIEARYFEQKRAESKDTVVSGKIQDSSRHCPLCGYSLMDGWKFCPECGVSLLKK